MSRTAGWAERSGTIDVIDRLTLSFSQLQFRMIRSFRNKALQRFWAKGETSGLRPDWITKVRLLLDALDNARRPEDLNVTGTGFHPLRGNLKGRYAMTVSRNWRLTFGWDDQDAVELDLEDYHGR